MLLCISVPFLIAFQRLTQVSGKPSFEFSYTGKDGVEFWAQKVFTCNGRGQSPINIDPKLADEVSMSSLKFGKGYKEEVEGTIKNNGYSVLFTPDPKAAGKLTLSGGPLADDKYVLNHLHFHWGSRDDQGSEHTVNNRRFPLEMHLVHVNQRYRGELENALDKPDGVLVVGVFFELDPSDGQNAWMDGFDSRPAIQPDFLLAMTNVLAKDKEVNFPALNLSMVADLDDIDYYTYMGSLTSPNCNEGVKWILSTSLSFIGCKQLEVFRKLYGKSIKSKLSDNFRPTQPLHGRRIYKVNSISPKALGAAGVNVVGKIDLLSSVDTEGARHNDLKDRVNSALTSGATIGELKQILGIKV